MTAGILFTGGGAVYPGVNFDGTNDYLVRASDFTGNADSKKFTICGWFANLNSGSGLTPQIWIAGDFTGGNAGFSVNAQSSGLINISGSNAAGGGILQVLSTAGALPSSATWKWLGISIDMANSSQSKIYVNDTDVTATPSTFTNDTFDLTKSIHYCGATNSGSGAFNLLQSDVAELWVGYGQHIDFSIEANRRKFVTSSGKPTFLGADGSTPTGVAPTVYFRGGASTFPTNQGTGGAMTLVGSLTNSATNPSD
jgi:hypothetical protein